MNPVVSTRRLVAGLALAGLLFGCSTETPGPSKSKGPKPDLMLITVDTLRSDHMGPYRDLYAGPDGPAQVETPAFDEFADASRVYATAYTAIPLTTASLGSMLTGKLPRHHGALNNSMDLSGDVRTIVMALDEAGYDTAAFLPTFLAGKPGFERGFDVYDYPELGQPGRDGFEVVKRAMKWLEGHDKDAPTFVWIHLFDPHAPYDPGPELERKHLGDLAGKIPDYLREEVFLDPSQTYDKEIPIVRGLYRGDVELTDNALAPLFRLLLDRPATERERLTILTADHGEHLAERESYIGHTGFLHEEMLLVPFIVHSSTGAIESGIIDYPAFTPDVSPTFAEYSGIGGQWGYDSGAKPLLSPDFLEPLAELPADEQRLRFMVHETFAPEGFYDQMAARYGDSKYIVETAPERPAGFYLMDGGPAVTEDILADQDSWSSDVRARFDEITGRMDAWQATTDPILRIDSTLTQEQREALDAMGYMGDDHGHGAPPKKQPTPSEDDEPGKDG